MKLVKGGGGGGLVGYNHNDASLNASCAGRTSGRCRMSRWSQSMTRRGCYSSCWMRRNNSGDGATYPCFCSRCANEWDSDHHPYLTWT